MGIASTSSRSGAGSLQLIVFVRHALWEVREDRKGIQRWLGREHEEEVELVGKAPSKLATHPDAIFSFIDEVVRQEDARSGGRPLANWVSQFDTFDEVIGSLRIHLGIQDHGTLVAQLNLRHELLTILQVFIHKAEASLMPAFWFATAASRAFTGDPSGTTFLESKAIKRLLAYSIFPCRVRHDVLDSAIKRGLFLEIRHGRPQMSPVHQHLLFLQRDLCWLDEFSPTTGRDWLFAEDDVQVNNTELAPYIARCQRESNVVSLCKALLRWTDGHPFVAPQLQPTTPFRDMVDAIEEETATHGELMHWVNDGL